MALSTSKTDRDFNKFREASGNNTKIAVSVEQDAQTPLETTSYSYKTIIDEVNKNLSYVGDSEPSTATSASLWKIRRIQTIGTVTTIAYADGNSDFDNIWDNRASLTYS
jgi:hypothetical protein